MAGENETGAEGGADIAEGGQEVEAGTEGSEGGEAAPPVAGQQRGPDGKFKPPAPEKRRFKFRAAGEEVEAELTDEEVAQQLSLARGAQKKMWEAAQERKQAAAEREALKKEREQHDAARKALAGDPRKLRAWVREQTGGDAEKAHKLLVAVMKEEIAELNLDPRERRLRELEAEKQQREADDAESKTKAEREKLSAETQAKVGQLREKFIADLTGIMDLVNVPASERALAIAAELYMENRTGANLSKEELAEVVKEETVGFALDITKEWTAEQWQQLDPATYRKIVKHAADGVRGRQAGASGTAPARREGPAVGKKGAAPDDAPRVPYGTKPPSKPLTRAEEKAIYG